MSGFIEGENRYQSTLFPERIDDYVEEDSAALVCVGSTRRLDYPFMARYWPIAEIRCPAA